MKIEIAASLMDCNLDDIDEKTKQKMCLHVGDGGLGIMNSYQISHSAYIASMMESAETIQNTIQMSLNDAKDEIPSIDALFRSIDYFNRFVGLDDDLTIESVGDMLGTIGKGETLQNLLSEFYRPIHKQKVMDLLESTAEVAHFVSAGSVDSGLIFETQPKSLMHTMSNSEMTTAIRSRLFMAQKVIVPNSRCQCGKPVDPQGLHLTCGCNTDSTRTLIHDLVTDQIGVILKYCDVAVKSEQRGEFWGSDPNNNQRPDLTVYNLAGVNQPYLLDTMITCTSPPSGGGMLTMEAALIPGRAALQAEKYKNNMPKYKNGAPANNFGFTPIIFEVTGRMGGQVEHLLKSNLKRAAEQRNIPFTTLWRYWISSLMVIFHRTVSRAILKRAVNINGKFEENWENDDQAMRDFSLVNRNIGNDFE